MTLHATIEAGVPVASVVSPSHRLRSTLRGSTFDVRVGDGPVPADRDFVLRWQPSVGVVPIAGGLVEERVDGRFGLAMLVPPQLDPTGAGTFPTQTVFVVDVSGSMAGPSLAQAKAALHVALDRLRPGDTFTLIKFDSAYAAYSERFIDAGPDTIDAAKRWVSSLTAGSGTEILPALLRALDLSERGDAGVLKRVILITDGAVSNEDQVVAEVGRRLGGTRLHIVGIGLAPNRWLMKELARAGRGTFESIGAIADVKSKTVDLLTRTERAAITDVALEWEGAPPLDAGPDPVPDLYEGRPLIVTARFDPTKPLPKLRVWGRAPGGPVTMDVDFAQAGANAGIGTRWARARIAGLEQTRVHGADPVVVRADVIDLAKRFSLVTAYTSFVVVADESYAAEGVARDDGDGVLPQGGTEEPLLLIIGVALCALSGGLFCAASHARRLRA
jgi:Ca-activated chloride channel family protein